MNGYGNLPDTIALRRVWEAACANEAFLVGKSESEVRQRCYECFRPVSLCFCRAIPKIDNRTNILILQHVGERFHPFNTARIVRKALRRCQLIVDHNQRLGKLHLPIHADAGLLYPQANAPTLAELPAAARPRQLVLVDGTWQQAKTIFRDVPQLRDLPCYRLTPSAPGQYRIRREPDDQSLSTLEATVAALRALEGDTVGLDQLLSAFHEMVETQLNIPSSRAARRRKKTRESRHRHLPPALLQEADRLVVAYGEATPGQSGHGASPPLPVNWVAQRLGAEERFACRLQQSCTLSKVALDHMRLSKADFNTALTADEFRHQWNHFLRRNDVLVVYNQRTFHLLRNIDAAQPRCLVLKSIFGKWQTDFHSLESLLAAEGVTTRPSADTSRAGQRLDMALALVEHLRAR